MRKNYKSDPVRETIATYNQPTSPSLTAPMRWAGRVAAIATLLACVSTTSFAADMPMKAAAASRLSMVGLLCRRQCRRRSERLELRHGVDPGTHLLDADPAVVAANGSGSHGGDGLLAGGQVGCNCQSGLLVAGLEGDFDYFHSNPWFSNNTDHAERWRNAVHDHAIPHDELPGDHSSRASASPPIGISPT